MQIDPSERQLLDRTIRSSGTTRDRQCRCRVLVKVQAPCQQAMEHAEQ